MHIIRGKFKQASKWDKIERKEDRRMARVGRCQSVIVNDIKYMYGQIVPYIRWKGEKDKNEMWDAEITSVSGFRENTVSFTGKDINGTSFSITIDMDNIIDL